MASDEEVHSASDEGVQMASYEEVHGTSAGPASLPMSRCLGGHREQGTPCGLYVSGKWEPRSYFQRESHDNL